MWKQLCGAVLQHISHKSLRSIKSLEAYSSLVSRMRSFSDNSKLSSIGGGLEKLQGGLKEETYFQTQNYDLINKIREQGSKLKCESSINEWPAFEKVLESAVPTKTALRESCSVNRHKNCLEEAFFLEEQNDCAKIIKVKLSEESKESTVQFEIQTKCKQMQE